MNYWFKSIYLIVVLVFSLNTSAQSLFTHYLTIGTYTNKSDPGVIYIYKFDSKTGQLVPHNKFEGILNTSYLTFGTIIEGTPLRSSFLVNENPGEETGALTQMCFNSVTGDLEFIDEKPTQGDAPCYVTVSPDNKFVLTANYTGGSLSLFRTTPEGLKFQEVHRFNDVTKNIQSHIHSVQFDKSGKRMLVSDLKQSKLFVVEIQDKKPNAHLKVINKLTYSSTPSSGPRHFVFNADGTYVYVLNEWAGTIDVLKYHKGKMSFVQNVLIDSTDLVRKGSADIHISPDGKFLYASNRLKNDGIAILRIEANHQLSFVAYQATGKHPRNFLIDDAGNYLLCANRDSNTVEVFKRQQDTGLLTKVEEVRVNLPVCLKLIPITSNSEL